YSSIAAQPAPVIQTVLSDDAHVGCDQILQPREYPRRIEVVGVRMADREIESANAAAFVVGDTDAADIPTAPGPRRTTVCAYAIIARLNVERDDPGAAQVGQCIERSPIGRGQSIGAPVHDAPRNAPATRPSTCFNLAISRATPTPGRCVSRIHRLRGFRVFG